MNPGPWGMAQTGIPFGEINAVQDWMKITAPVGTPENTHPAKPVTGFSCTRSEVSGRRLWGWASHRFGTPERFFQSFFVINYCPLLFLEEGGRNLTPDRLRAGDRKPLFEICDRALLRTIEILNPECVIGVGLFAEKRIKTALSGTGRETGRISHPSPANPAANRGWQALIEREFSEQGITF